MPRKRKTPRPDAVSDFRHAEARRKNNPPAGIAPTYEVRERQTTHYSDDPHLDPQLVWAGKAEHTSFEVDVVSFHIHERVSTKPILDAVRRPRPVQPPLFGETPLPPGQEVEFYRPPAPPSIPPYTGGRGAGGWGGMDQPPHPGRLPTVILGGVQDGWEFQEECRGYQEGKYILQRPPRCLCGRKDGGRVGLRQPDAHKVPLL